jgi:hypothetical protein
MFFKLAPALERVKPSGAVVVRLVSQRTAVRPAPKTVPKKGNILIFEQLAA